VNVCVCVGGGGRWGGCYDVCLLPFELVSSAIIVEALYSKPGGVPLTVSSSQLILECSRAGRLPAGCDLSGSVMKQY